MWDIRVNCDNTPSQHCRTNYFVSGTCTMFRFRPHSMFQILVTWSLKVITSWMRCSSEFSVSGLIRSVSLSNVRMKLRTLIRVALEHGMVKLVADSVHILTLKGDVNIQRNNSFMISVNKYFTWRQFNKYTLTNTTVHTTRYFSNGCAS